MKMIVINAAMIKFIFRAVVVLFSSLYFMHAASAQEAVINMGSTVKGNQEQPKVLYIVPWKAPEGPSALYQTIDSQLEAVFSHVDRAEFRRQLKYIEHMSAKQTKEK